MECRRRWRVPQDSSVPPLFIGRDDHVPLRAEFKLVHLEFANGATVAKDNHMINIGEKCSLRKKQRQRTSIEYWGDRDRDRDRVDIEIEKQIEIEIEKQIER